MLYLRLFGGIKLEGANLELSKRAAQKKRLALLALLGASPTRSLTRDRLVGLLWPESDSERARHLLASSVYELRKALGEDVILSAGDDLRLNPERITSDVWEFSDALERGDLETAVALYKGPLLDGVFISEADEFERWCQSERDRLTRTYADALTKLAERAEAKGDAAAAVAWWRQLAAHDRLSSRAALRLMRALVAVGDRAGAVQHARDHVLLLREELGVDPDPAVFELAAELSRPLGIDWPPSRQPSLGDGQRAAVTPVPATAAAPFSRSTPRRRYAVPLIGAAAVLAAAAIVVIATRNRSPERVTRSSPVVAVLPLDNLSGDTTQEFIAAGLTEALITELAGSSEMRVISRTSVLQYSRPRKNLREIARELGADLLVEGSVIRERDSLRIHAQLIRGSTDEHIWAASYAGDRREILDLQARIARAIASEIGVALRPPLQSTSVRAVDPSAYEAYLKGVYYSGVGDLRASNAAYEEAVRLDSMNAAAYAGIARNYYFVGFFSLMPPATVFAKVRAAAEKALQIDENMADAHATLGLHAMHYELDMEKAEKHLRRALELAPSSAQVRHDYAHFLLTTQRGSESVVESERAVELDRYSAALVACLGWHQLVGRNNEQGIQEALRALRLEEFFFPHLILGWAYEQKRMFPEAIASLQQAVKQSGGLPIATASLAHAMAVSGQRPQAEEILGELMKRAESEYVAPYEIAAIYAGLGKPNEAFDWLRKAHNERSTFVVFASWDPRFYGLRADARFGRLMQELKLPVPAVNVAVRS